MVSINLYIINHIKNKNLIKWIITYYKNSTKNGKGKQAFL